MTKIKDENAPSNGQIVQENKKHCGQSVHYLIHSIACKRRIPRDPAPAHMTEHLELFSLYNDGAVTSVQPAVLAASKSFLFFLPFLLLLRCGFQPFFLASRMFLAALRSARLDCLLTLPTTVLGGVVEGDRRRPPKMRRRVRVWLCWGGCWSPAVVSAML